MVWARAKELEVQGQVSLAPVMTRLHTDQVSDAEAAVQMLGHPETNLIQAVEFFNRHYRPINTEIILRDTIDEFFWEHLDHVRERSAVQLRSSLRLFARHIGPETKVHEISTKTCEDYLRRKNWKPKTFNNMRADLHVFFNYCTNKQRRYIHENPVHDIPKKKIHRSLPDTLNTRQAAELMNYVERYRDGAMVRYFALALFAGIRPAGELYKLHESDEQTRLIDLRNKVIHILPEISKTNQYRQVMIRKPLLEYLKNHPQPILPTGWDRMAKHVRQKFELTHDVLRHTFYSMHIAMFKSVGAAAIEGGSSEYIVGRHYLNLKTLGEGETFWRLGPRSTDDKIVALA